MSSNLRPLAKAAPRETRESARRHVLAEFIGYRIAAGMSQLEAAQLIGVSRSTVEDWERGETKTIPADAVKLM